MVAGLIKLILKPDKVQEAIDYWNSTLSAAKKENPFLMKEKLQGSIFLVDRKTGHAYSFGLWSTAEASEEFQRSEFYTRLVGELGKFCLKPPVREKFDVVGGSMEYVLLENFAA